EVRNPREIRNPNSEKVRCAGPKVHAPRYGFRSSDFGLRISFGSRHSDFGFCPWVSVLIRSHGSSSRHSRPSVAVIPPITRKIFDNLILSINTNPHTNTPALL